MNIAFLGAGLMGAPMIRNLVEAGHDVTAYNRTREKAEGLGAAVADSAAAAVAGAEAVVTMLADGAAVLDTMQGVTLDEGTVWWQASTVGLDATDQLSRLAGDAAFVDAPVLGTKGPAEQGALTILASGPTAAQQTLAPLFEATGQRTVDLGEEAGAGSRMKLVINGWLVALLGGLAEAVHLAETLGVDPSQFIDIIDGGPMGPPYAKLKGSMMIERSYDPSFSLALAAKDAGLVGAAAAAYGIELPTVAATGRTMRRGVDEGHGEQDMAAIVEALRSARS